jgi:hypothetical protein
MKKLETQNELLEANFFQVEELEERLETCWQRQRWVQDGWYDQYNDWHDTSYQVSC